MTGLEAVIPAVVGGLGLAGSALGAAKSVVGGAKDAGSKLPGLNFNLNIGANSCNCCHWCCWSGSPRVVEETVVDLAARVPPEEVESTKRVVSTVFDPLPTASAGFEDHKVSLVSQLCGAKSRTWRYRNFMTLGAELRQWHEVYGSVTDLFFRILLAGDMLAGTGSETYSSIFLSLIKTCSLAEVKALHKEFSRKGKSLQTLVFSGCKSLECISSDTAEILRDVVSAVEGAAEAAFDVNVLALRQWGTEHGVYFSSEDEFTIPAKRMKRRELLAARARTREYCLRHIEVPAYQELFARVANKMNEGTIFNDDPRLLTTTEIIHLWDAQRQLWPSWNALVTFYDNFIVGDGLSSESYIPESQRGILLALHRRNEGTTIDSLATACTAVDIEVLKQVVKERMDHFVANLREIAIGKPMAIDLACALAGVECKSGGKIVHALVEEEYLRLAEVLEKLVLPRYDNLMTLYERIVLSKNVERMIPVEEGLHGDGGVVSIDDVWVDELSSTVEEFTRDEMNLLTRIFSGEHGADLKAIRESKSLSCLTGDQLGLLMRYLSEDSEYYITALREEIAKFGGGEIDSPRNTNVLYLACGYKGVPFSVIDDHLMNRTKFKNLCVAAQEVARYYDGMVNLYDDICAGRPLGFYVLSEKRIPRDIRERMRREQGPMRDLDMAYIQGLWRVAQKTSNAKVAIIERECANNRTIRRLAFLLASRSSSLAVGSEEDYNRIESSIPLAFSYYLALEIIHQRVDGVPSSPSRIFSTGVVDSPRCAAMMEAGVAHHVIANHFAAIQAGRSRHRRGLGSTHRSVDGSGELAIVEAARLRDILNERANEFIEKEFLTYLSDATDEDMRKLTQVVDALTTHYSSKLEELSVAPEVIDMICAWKGLGYRCGGRFPLTVIDFEIIARNADSMKLNYRDVLVLYDLVKSTDDVSVARRRKEVVDALRPEDITIICRSPQISSLPPEVMEKLIDLTEAIRLKGVGDTSVLGGPVEYAARARSNSESKK